VLVEADPDEVDDVGVIELAHDERLHQEVHLSCNRQRVRTPHHRYHFSIYETDSGTYIVNLNTKSVLYSD
jgi:hypothetical protein